MHNYAYRGNIIVALKEFICRACPIIVLHTSGLEMLPHEMSLYILHQYTLHLKFG